MSDYEQHPAVREMKRELAVARQTIRSLQDALAAEHKDDEALRAAARELVNSFHKSDGSAFAARDRLVEALEGAPALASSGSEREQALENALRVAAREAAGGNERTYERLTALLWCPRCGHDNHSPYMCVMHGCGECPGRQLHGYRPEKVDHDG